MTFRLTQDESLTSGTTATIGVGKSRALLIPVTLSGLMPNSEFTFFVDGIDMTWATAQKGKRMGTGILSDEFGKISFDYYAEMSAIESNKPYPIMKRHHFQLKNIRGESKATTIISQLLRVRT